MCLWADFRSAGCGAGLGSAGSETSSLPRGGGGTHRPKLNLSAYLRLCGDGPGWNSSNFSDMFFPFLGEKSKFTEKNMIQFLTKPVGSRAWLLIRRPAGEAVRARWSPGEARSPWGLWDASVVLAHMGWTSAVSPYGPSSGLATSPLPAAAGAHIPSPHRPYFGTETRCHLLVQALLISLAGAPSVRH